MVPSATRGPAVAVVVASAVVVGTGRLAHARVDTELRAASCLPAAVLAVEAVGERALFITCYQIRPWS